MTVAANNINIAAIGDLNFDSSNAKGNFTANAGHNINLNDVTVGGNLDATALQGIITRTGTLLVAGFVKLQAANDTISGFVTDRILDSIRTFFVPETTIPTNSNPSLVIVPSTTDTIGTTAADTDVVSTVGIGNTSFEGGPGSTSTPADTGASDSVAGNTGISTWDGGISSSSDGQQITIRFAGEGEGVKPSDNLETALPATVSIVILETGAQPDAAGFFALTEVDGTFVMSPIDGVSGNVIGSPGKLLNQIEMQLVNEHSSKAVFKLEMSDNSLVIKPEGKQAEEMIKNKRNQVVGLALATLRKQANVSIKAIRTVFVIL